MQPYRQTRPHGDGCAMCAPNAPGHQMCQHDGCGELAETQHRRHATAAEYEALPEAFRPIDGIAHRAVFTCLDHEVDSICGDGDHVQPAAPAPADAPPCPKCGAGAGDPCTKANNKVRGIVHDVRGVGGLIGVMHGACTHVHREDCGGQGSCPCSASDEAPARRARIIDPPPLPAPAPIHVATHGPTQAFLSAHSIDTARVMSLDLVPGAEGPVALRAVLMVTDHQGNVAFDEHGRPQTEGREILLAPVVPQGQR